MCVDYDPKIDSLSYSTIHITYSGNSSHCSYKSKKQIPDSLVSKLRSLYFSKKESKKDSLKKEGIKFSSYSLGSGSLTRVNKQFIHVQDTTIAEIKNVCDTLDGNYYGGTFVILKIKNEGATYIIPNKTRKSFKAKLVVKSGSVEIEGQKIYKVKHKKSFFAYLLRSH